MNKIVIVTDAWEPMVNGVTTTLSHTVDYLKRWGYDVHVIHPGLFRTMSLPKYPEIRVVIKPTYKPFRIIDDSCAVHLATEFTVGILGKLYCQRHHLKYTTSYCTDFPFTLKKHIHLPEFVSYKWLKWFHRGAETIMVSTASIASKLDKKKFKNLSHWGRGVDTDLFRPQEKTPRTRPIALYVGRVAAEKSIGEFLALKGNYDKIVVGDGPSRKALEHQYPDVKFTGYLKGEALARAYADADVFVFPSASETFGLVIVEALACGVPVAAYPVQGPIDILLGPGTGCLDHDLGVATEKALMYGNAADCRALAMSYSWEKCSQEFVGNLVFNSDR